MGSPWDARECVSHATTFLCNKVAQIDGGKKKGERASVINDDVCCGRCVSCENVCVGERERESRIMRV